VKRCLKDDESGGRGASVDCCHGLPGFLRLSDSVNSVVSLVVFVILVSSEV
jgi:hypothetical protein